MSAWRFHHIGLLVTGKAEEECVPLLLNKALAGATGGRCVVQTIRRVEQLRPRRASTPAPKLAVAGSKGLILRRDEEIALAARMFLRQHRDGLVVLLDDEERTGDAIDDDGRIELHGVFERYRDAFDGMLGGDARRVGVFFLRRMLEAYYFAQPEAIGLALDVESGAFDGADVEALSHPKGRLKGLCQQRGRAFNEREDGRTISGLIELDVILDGIETCASLRALVAWCMAAVGGCEAPDRFQLAGGIIDRVTGPQLGLPAFEARSGS